MGASNEPDFASCGSSIGPPCYSDYDTMVYTANEMVAFIKVLGPKLKTAGVKLIAPEPSEWIHLWSNASATGSTVAGHPNSSDPLKCGCFSNTPTTTGCASNLRHGQRIRLRPLPGQGCDGVGLHRHHRDARVRLAKGGSVAVRRRRRQEKQDDLRDRGVGRPLLAERRAVERHRQRRRGRRVDSLRRSSSAKLRAGSIGGTRRAPTTKG